MSRKLVLNLVNSWNGNVSKLLNSKTASLGDMVSAVLVLKLGWAMALCKAEVVSYSVESNAVRCVLRRVSSGCGC
jgi:hypothetical protein